MDAARLRTRLRGEERGFTLVEMLVVLLIISILLLIAVISYTGARGRAGDSTAGSNVRAALPSIYSFYSDRATYVGLTRTALAAYDNGLSPTLTFSGLSATAFCVQDSAGGSSAHFRGPGGRVAKGPC